MLGGGGEPGSAVLVRVVIKVVGAAGVSVVDATALLILLVLTRVTVLVEADFE